MNELLRWHDGTLFINAWLVLGLVFAAVFAAVLGRVLANWFK